VRARKVRDIILRKYWRNIWVFKLNGDLVILSTNTGLPLKTYKEGEYVG